MIIEIAASILTLYSTFATTSGNSGLNASTAPTTQNIQQIVTSSQKPKEGDEMEQYVKDYFQDVPVLAEISRCESQFRQNSISGDVLRGSANKKDVGLMQINEEYHLPSAKKLGYDIYSVDGNLGYARYLYEHYNVQPWVSSSKCWKGSGAYKELTNK